ncbi:hypothetical protein L3Q82_023087, partial [Scortum barcoo]
MTATGDYILMRGMEMGWIPAPRHVMKLDCELVQGIVSVGVRPELQIEGVSMVLGNDLAGSRMWANVAPPTIATEPLVPSALEESQLGVPRIFAVTLAQSRKGQDWVEGQRADTFPVWTVGPVEARCCKVCKVMSASLLENLVSVKSIVRALTQFISTFGIPLVIQCDQGSNFTSHMFEQVLKQLGVKHNCSTAYHALERFHQTLKSMLRSYGMEMGKGLGGGTTVADVSSQVNKVTKADSYPLPRMQDCIDLVGSAKFVSKFDLLKGYWQVPLTARAREISAFTTPFGLFEYTVMSFGLCNAPATFQRLMNLVVSGLDGCAVYLDDVVVFSDSWDDHLHRISALFGRLAEAHLTVNLAKCEFARATVTYLGRVVGQGQVHPVDAKVQAVVQNPVPTTKKELMRFLGLVGCYRSF